MEPLVTGLVEQLGPLMQGLLETPGLTVAGHLVHGQVKEAPIVGSGRRKRSLRGVRDSREYCGEWETGEKIAGSGRQKRRLRGVGDRREDCGE